MREIILLFMPFVASPALLLLLRFLNVFNLPGLAHWSFPAHVPAFICAAVGAIVAYVKVRSSRRRVIRLAIALLLFLSSLLVYDHVFQTPPTEHLIALYDAAGYASFFLCHAAFGFCAAEVCKFFTDRRVAGKR